MIDKIKQTNPLIHHITNYVSTQLCANVCLAIGASPLMADEEDEMSEIAAISSAFVMNIGTLNYRTLDSGIDALEHYSKLQKPIILDPVGVGASRFRTAGVNELLRAGDVSIIKGNAAEIASILGVPAQAKGVDSHQEISQDFIQSAKDFAAQNELVLAISGKIDYVIGTNELVKIANGHVLATKITAAGCALSSVMAAYASVCEPFMAAKLAFIHFGLACQTAASVAAGPGSFTPALLDALYELDASRLSQDAKVL